MPDRRLTLIAAAAAVALLAGCAVGPDHRAPTPSLDARFAQPGMDRAAGAASASAGAEVRPVGADIARFWRGFNDPALTALVERALDASPDVRLAQARLQEARAQDNAHGEKAARYAEWQRRHAAAKDSHIDAAARFQLANERLRGSKGEITEIPGFDIYEDEKV